jgi:uncharacterized protein with von Willebrand factor type A (vWA) domain
VLDSQFRGMKQACSNPDPQAMQRVKDMLADLNADAGRGRARRAHPGRTSTSFMAEYGDMFPDTRATSRSWSTPWSAGWRRRAAAALAQPEAARGTRRADGQALEDAGLAAEMARLADALRSRRPELDRAGMAGGVQMSGEEPLGLGDATTRAGRARRPGRAGDALGQDYPGASLDDIDEEAVRRALGRQAVDDVEALRRIERELERQGYLARTAASSSSPPRRCAGSATRRCAGSSPT